MCVGGGEGSVVGVDSPGVSRLDRHGVWGAAYQGELAYNSNPDANHALGTGDAS